MPSSALSGSARELTAHCYSRWWMKGPVLSLHSTNCMQVSCCEEMDCGNLSWQKDRHKEREEERELEKQREIMVSS